MNIPYILIPVLIGLICGILGYFIGKMNAKKDDVSISLQPELDFCRENSKKLSARIAELEVEVANAKIKASTDFQSFAEPPIAFDDDLAATVYGKKIKENDLKIIKGVGSKIEKLYHHAGIDTWLALSETSTEESQAILDAGNENFSMHNPETWAGQAKLAYEGKWQELKNWQDDLDGGKE
jgi:predicted flap endonuclease-1-like 5' DNA nuclease